MTVSLSDLARAGSVIPELAAADRGGVIRELVQSLADRGAVDAVHVETLVQAVIARENLGSTGFGRGVAVPHVKHPCVTRMVAAIGRSVPGVDFAALDRAPVYTILILLSPPSAPDEHLAAMKRIFQFFQHANFRSFLRQADTREAIMELVAEAEDDLPDA